MKVIPQEIGKVILNLLNNGFYSVLDRKVKYEQDSDEYQPMVKISTSQTTDKKGSSYILISVMDNGTGIPDHIKEKIFQPFFTTKPTGSGTGLGLSLAYDIVLGHGGEITVTSTEGKGSEFIVSLPVN